MSGRKKSPLEAKRAMLIDKKRKLRRVKKEIQRQKLAEEALKRDKKQRQRFNDFQIGDFVQITDSMDPDSSETKILASHIYGDFTSLMDMLCVISAKKSKKKYVVVVLLKGDNLESLKDKYSPDEFPSVMLHYSFLKKLDSEESEEMQRYYDSVSVKVNIEDADLVTLYVVKQGNRFSSKLNTRRWSLYCNNDIDPDPTALFHIADCVVTKEQDQKEMDSPFVEFVWSEDTINNCSFQPYRQSSLEKLATITKATEATKKDPRSLQTLPHVNKVFVGRPRKTIPVFHKGVSSTNKEQLKKVMTQCSSKSDDIDMGCFTDVFQLQPIHSETDVSSKLFLEDRRTLFEQMYTYVEDNRFLMLPVPVKITKKRDTEFAKTDRVRIINEIPKKKSSEINVQYMIGEVTNVLTRTNKCSVLIGSVRYSVPMESLSHIRKEQDSHSAYQQIQALDDTPFIENTTEVEYLERKRDLDLATSVDQYVLDHNSKKEIYSQFLEDNIDKQQLLSAFYIDPVRPHTLYLDAVTDLLTISDYEPPKLKEHLQDQLNQMLQNGLESSSTLLRNMEYKISYSWPPRVGDNVYIMGGVYRGETGKIICINKGLGVASYGEAVVELDGLYRAKCMDSYIPTDRFPCKKWGSRTYSYHSHTSRSHTQSQDSSVASFDSDLRYLENLGSSASQVSPPKSPIKYYSGSKVHKWLSNFHVAKPFEYKGNEYTTVEHAFHAQKIDPSMSKTIKDEYRSNLIVGGRYGLDPRKAKKFGSSKNFKKNGYRLNPEWDDRRVQIMEDILTHYYNANPELKQKLLETGDAPLIHRGYRIDAFWGEKKDAGENHHGHILMKLRSKFQRSLSKSKSAVLEDSPVASPLSPSPSTTMYHDLDQDSRSMKKMLHTITLTYLLPIIDEELPLSTKLWRGSLRTYISFNVKETLTDIVDDRLEEIAIEPPIDTNIVQLDEDFLDDTYHPLNMLLKEDQLVRITSGKYENFIALITDKIYIHDKHNKNLTNIEKAWDLGMINTVENPSANFLDNYPYNGVRLGNQYYVRLELYEDLYEEVAEMMGKSEQWLKDFFATVGDKYGPFPERKKFMFLTVPPLQERTLPEDILFSIYQKQELELISSGKAKQHCTRQLMRSQQQKSKVDDIKPVQLPTLTSYVVIKGIRELKKQLKKKADIFEAGDIMVYEYPKIADDKKTKEPSQKQIFSYDL